MIFVGMDGDGPGVDRAGERIAVAVDDVAAFGDQRGQALLAAGMIAERRETQDAERDQRDDAGIDQHAEHQPLVHDGEQLAALADELEPLGPWRDESGRRGVHRSAVESLELPECLAGSGASGSTFAIRTGFVTGLARQCGLIHGFLGAWPPTPLWAAFWRGWAAARPGLSTDFFVAGFAAVAGLSVDWPVARGNATTVLAGTSRVSVFRLAS